MQWAADGAPAVGKLCGEAARGLHDEGLAAALRYCWGATTDRIDSRRSKFAYPDDPSNFSSTRFVEDGELPNAV